VTVLLALAQVQVQERARARAPHNSGSSEVCVAVWWSRFILWLNEGASLMRVDKGMKKRFSSCGKNQLKRCH
jgi:hypothetical protein